MSNDLLNLYQETIMDHNRHPRNFRKIEAATSEVEGINPLCGDQISLYITFVEGVIKDIAFQGTGCAISVASASIMTTLVKNKKIEEAVKVSEQAHMLLTEGPNAELPLENIRELIALSDVHKFPTRIKCAALAWHTLKNSLNEKNTHILRKAKS